jgi:hypothetical protein
MAYTQAQRDALAAAIASGALTVRYGETSTTYRSLAEMRQVLAAIDQDLTAAAGARKRRVTKVTSTRDY